MTVNRDELAASQPSTAAPAPPAKTTSTGPGAAHFALRRLLRTCVAHPILTVTAVALAARTAGVVVLGPLHPGVVVPDEQQYLDLAQAVASGRGAESWQPGYGQSLYDSTAAFMRPLMMLVRIFGEHELCGQVLAATVGVAVATLTTVVALRVSRRDTALMTGLVVAALPSQVYWSSIVLRESMVWLALVAVAAAVAVGARATSGAPLCLSGLLAAGGLWALCDLRSQTAVVTAVALLLAGLVVRSAVRLVVPAGAATVAILIPALAGLGPLGADVVQRYVPQLASVRASLSLGAGSSFVPKTQLPPTPAAVSPPSPGSRRIRLPASVAVVTAPSGQRYAVDDSSGATLSAFPRGLVAVALRPFPWEPATSAGLLMAKLENLAWFGLYALSLVGLPSVWRRRDVLAFPVLASGAVLAVAAVTQGNLGTAFRHRGQILWTLALLAGVGLDRLRARRTVVGS